MLKKSLIPAALVALSSVSAFADSESSFYLGVKGLYFMPKKETSESFKSAIESGIPALNPTCKTRGIFLPGLQFGYNVSDSIRIGLAGYFGASKFKYETDCDAANSKIIDKRLDDIEATLRKLSTAGDASIAIAAAALVNVPGFNAGIITQLSGIALVPANLAPLKGELKMLDIGQKKRAGVADYPGPTGGPVAARLAALPTIAALPGGNPNGVGVLGAYASGLHPADIVHEVKLELGPRFAIFATMDAKLFETDAFSLGVGIGAGAAKWKASFSTEITKNGEKTTESSEPSAWKPAFMGTVNANINLGDVAVLTGSVGYAHLGTPKGLKTSDDKEKTFDADENKAKGWIFGIGIGKEF